MMLAAFLTSQAAKSVDVDDYGSWSVLPLHRSLSSHARGATRKISLRMLALCLNQVLICTLSITGKPWHHMRLSEPWKLLRTIETVVRQACSNNARPSRHEYAAEPSGQNAISRLALTALYFPAWRLASSKVASQTLNQPT